MQEGTISENSSLRKRRGESSEIEAKDDISEKSILKGTSDIQTTASKEKKPSFKDQFFTDDDLPLQPSLWKSPIYIFLNFQAFLIISFVLYLGWKFCKELVTYYKFSHIKPGWFFGRKQDLSDPQWRIWREIFPYLCVAFAIFLILSNLIRKFTYQEGKKNIIILLFYTIISLSSICVLHGYDTIWLLLISLINFAISRIFKGSMLNPFFTWVFNIIILWTADYYSGYSGAFTYLGFRWMERHGMLHWETYFKMTFLRHISFNLDYYWMINNKKTNLKDPSAYALASETHHEKNDYGLLEFFAYSYYIPFFIAGPVINFNAFLSQIKRPQITYPLKAIFKMLFQVLFYTLAFEIGLHFNYFYAFNLYNLWRDPSIPSYYTGLMGYWTLNFMYIKFLIIWRFFRVVALFDGIDSPENMNRCVNNNYTFAGFWRSWHGSMNKWIIRYMYIPLGGTQYIYVTVWIIFIFVGLWHDLKTQWVAWALINCCCIIGETAILAFFRRKKMIWLWKKWYWKYICVICAEVNIFLLMCANLAILHGFEGTPIFLKGVFFNGKPVGYLTLYSFFHIMFIGVMWMFEVREGERRRKEVKKF